MTSKDLIAKQKGNFDGIIEHYKNDIASIRTGRATPSLVEDIEVEAYGQKMKVKELASISVPEPRTLLIQPWDKSAVEAINGAIRKSDLGLSPVVDGVAVRLNIPQLTEDRRKEFIRSLKHKSEEARIKLRRVREEIWDSIQSLEKDGELREDDKFKGKEELQKTIDACNKKIEELELKKEHELMT